MYARQITVEAVDFDNGRDAEFGAKNRIFVGAVLCGFSHDSGFGGGAALCVFGNDTVKVECAVGHIIDKAFATFAFHAGAVDAFAIPTLNGVDAVDGFYGAFCNCVRVRRCCIFS